MEGQLERVSSKLTVFFEDPFWVGVFERVSCGKLSASKLTFGAEPKDYEVLQFINRNYYRLQFSPEIEAVVKDTGKNPKRAQRDAKKQTLGTGIGTKSQQALKLQQEQNKQERKAISREQREAGNRRLFELKQMKKREKHRGH
ncbi:MAG: YjdF family protein [Butyrivibrio sp.]|nr:YjdF family protein [Butyrivibrio sp.]